MNEGDRVLLKPHDSWLQPWGKLAKEKRPATIVRCFTPAGSAIETILIQFDVKRKGAFPRTLFVNRADIEPLDENPNTERKTA